MGFFTRLLNFEEQLTFYAAYHHNKVNKFIHVVCVPLIMWSVLVWLSSPTMPAYALHFPSLSSVYPSGSTANTLQSLVKSVWSSVPYLGQPATSAHILMVTPAWAVVFVYIVYYLLLEPIAGVMYAPFLGAMVYVAQRFVFSYGPQAPWLALYLHLGSWVFQFIGHGLFERRAPALLDSLVQAFLLAPLFVWMEVLFVLGYRPHLRDRLDKKAAIAIAEWQKSIKKKKN